jgi:hypothetical protein
VFDDLGHAGCGIFTGAAGGDERVDGVAVDLFNEVEEGWVG